MSLEAFLSIGNAIVHYYAYYHKQQRFSLDDSGAIVRCLDNKADPPNRLERKKGK
jgi:hypothetical protein